MPYPVFHQLAPALLGCLIATLVVGAGTGAWVALDAHLSHECACKLSDISVLRTVPYTLSALSAVAAVIVALLLRNRRWVWENRFAIGIVVVFLSLHLMAVDFGPINPLNLTIVALFALWLHYRLTKPEKVWVSSVFTTLVILFFGSALFSTIGHHGPEVLIGLLVLTPKLVLAVILVDLLDEQRKTQLALFAFMWTAGFFALAGIIQVLLYYVWQIELTLTDPSGPRYSAAGGMLLLRASGFAHTAQGFAQPLMVAAAVGFYLLLSPLGRGRQATLVMLSTLAGLAVVLSLARGQWVGLLVGLCAIPFIARPHLTFHWLGLAGVISVAALAAGLLPWAIDASVSLSPSGVSIRSVLMKAGLETLAEHPWNGVGINNFGAFSPNLDRYPVHNAVMQVGSELGMPGLLAFLAVLSWVGVRLLWAMLNTDEPVIKSQLGALLVGYLALAIAIQADPMAYSEFVWVYFALAEATARATLGSARR